MRYVTRRMAGLLGALGAFLIWGVLIEPRFILRCKTEVAEIPDLPSS